MKVCFTDIVTPFQAIEYFGSRSELATVCDVTDTAVYHWVTQGWIPYDKQCLIQVEAERAPRKSSRRRIVASWHDVPEERRKAAA